MSIGLRLTLSFATVAFIIICGAAVTGWEFAHVLRNSRALASIDDEVLAVYRVRADMDGIRHRLDDVSQAKDAALFKITARQQRLEFSEDVEHTLDSFRNSRIAMPQNLGVLRDTVDDQLDAMQRLADAQDWLAVRLRLDNQMDEILDSVREMVERVNSEVSAQRILLLDEIRTSQQSAQLIFLITAFASLLIALALGLNVTRGIVTPLRQLKLVAQQFAVGRFDVKIQPDSNNELGEVSRAFGLAGQRLNASYLELKRSNEALEQFAYAASHDLQEPLRTMSTFSELLKRRHVQELSPDARLHLSRITDAAAHMRQLVAGVLEYSRLAASAGQQEENVETEEIVDLVLDNLQAVREQAAAVVTRDHLPAVLGARLQLIQLFQNLISNAIKYRRDDVPPEIHISAKPESGMWKFCVADNGIGIDSQHHARIFGMFKRLDRGTRGGVGLGLAICKQIVEAHGGQISIASHIGQGSRFYFTLKNATQPDRRSRLNNLKSKRSAARAASKPRTKSTTEPTTFSS